jgi:hypothetical protein
MLTEKGFDEALRISDIPTKEKNSLPIKSYEVQKVVKKLLETRRPENYQPFDRNRKLVRIVREIALNANFPRMKLSQSAIALVITSTGFKPSRTRSTTAFVELGKRAFAIRLHPRNPR